MKLAYKFVKGLFPIFLFLLFPFPSFAQYHYQLIPTISAGFTYDDNIYLAPINEEDDYITFITPGIRFDILTENTSLDLRYAPTFAFYKEFKENNTTRHLATLKWDQRVAEHLKFDFNNTFYKQEVPIEYDPNVTGIRRGDRRPYWRNIGDARLSLDFGPQNSVSLGYRLNYLENEDPDINDGRIQRPFSTLTYWFNIKNGLELSYEYIKGDFWNDVFIPTADYTGHTPGIRYLYRFSPHTSASIGYQLTTREFDQFPALDFDVHDIMAGFDHSFSPDTTLFLNVGYFRQETESFGDLSDPTYDVSFTKRFEHGSFTIGGRGGWWFYGDYIDPQNRGFTNYYSGNARLTYQILESLSISAGGFYRLDRRDFDKREWDIWRGDARISLAFLQYFTLSLEYLYADRDDDVDTADYKNNRVMLSLTAGKLYRW